MRAAFVKTLTELARKDERVMLVIGDTGFSVFEGFEAEFKDRFVNVGIAEQNFVAFSAGLAAMGMKPFAYNVVSFMTLRAMEHIVLDVCYQENPVVLVGVGGGFSYATAGPTHHALHDIAMMSCLPGMTVICPADPAELREAVIAAASMSSPVYIRIGRSVDPALHDTPIDFEVGKGICMKEGEDVCLLATGTIVKDALKACAILESRGVSAALYSVHTVKPLDEELVTSCAKKYRAVLTAEEHSVLGGLGSAVASVLAREGCGVKFRALGAADMFAPVTGDRDYLTHINGIDAEGIAKSAMELICG